MSIDKRMDFETAVRTVLEKNPGLRARFLIEQLREKTGLSRSTIYEHLGSLVLREKIFREKGRYWLEKPKAPNRKDEEIRNEIAKIKEDYISHNISKAFNRLVLLADRINELQLHPSIVYASERKKLVDRFGGYHPILPLREKKLKRAIIRTMLKKMESILIE